MNKKYERYINYIVDELEPPYFINMRDQYGLSSDEYEMVLSKVYNQPVTIEGNGVGNSVYDDQNKRVYFESTDGRWVKRKFDKKGNQIYFEDSIGYWKKWGYDGQGKKNYYKDSYGNIVDHR